MEYYPHKKPSIVKLLVHTTTLDGQILTVEKNDGRHFGRQFIGTTSITCR